MSWLTLEPLAPARGCEFVVKVAILRFARLGRWIIPAGVPGFAALPEALRVTDLP